MNAEEILAAAPQRWGFAPLRSLSPPQPTGVAAAIWSGAPAELWGDSLDVHVLSVGLSATEFSADVFIDGKAVGAMAFGMGRLQLMRAHTRPRALMGIGWRLLHLYLPKVLLTEAIEETGASHESLELIDPFGLSDPDLTPLLLALAREIEADITPSRLFVDSLSSAVAVLLVRRWSNFRESCGVPVPARSDWRIRRVIDRLEAALSEDIGLAELATEADLSARHLSELFRTTTGLPPHRWLMRRRVERAREMLADPRVTVTEIAHTCGFASSQHLATVFKKHTGVTPSEYRCGVLL